MSEALENRWQDIGEAARFITGSLMWPRGSLPNQLVKLEPQVVAQLCQYYISVFAETWQQRSAFHGLNHTSEIKSPHKNV